MCRDSGLKSDIADEEFDLAAYRFGQVTKVDEPAGSSDDSGWQDVEIEFKFNDKTVAAKGSDLLYWSVPELDETDAASRMGALADGESEDVESSPDAAAATATDDEDVGDDGEEDEELPPRKRKARDILDPSTYVAARVIQDDSSDDSDYKELFPDSDDEEEQEKASPPTAWGTSASTSNGWGSPTSTSGTSGWGQSTSGVSASGWGQATSSSSASGWGQSASSSSASGWGQQPAVVTPTGSNPSGWGTASPSSNTAVWETSSLTNTTGTFDGPVSYRTPPRKPSKRSSSQYAVETNSVLEVVREDDSHFFLRWFFGGRIKIKEVAANLQNSGLDKTLEFGGVTYHLVASKYEKQKGRSFHADKFSGDYVKAFFLAEKNGVSTQKEFDGIANFAELAMSPGKLAKRLELLVSTAACSTGKNKAPYTFLLPTSLVEEIDLPDNATMGCGFISPNILSELLGGGKRADLALGVRGRSLIAINT